MDISFSVKCCLCNKQLSSVQEFQSHGIEDSPQSLLNSPTLLSSSSTSFYDSYAQPIKVKPENREIDEPKVEFGSNTIDADIVEDDSACFLAQTLSIPNSLPSQIRCLNPTRGGQRFQVVNGEKCVIVCKYTHLPIMKVFNLLEDNLVFECPKLEKGSTSKCDQCGEKCTTRIGIKATGLPQTTDSFSYFCCFGHLIAYVSNISVKNWREKIQSKEKLFKGLETLNPDSSPTTTTTTTTTSNSSVREETNEEDASEQDSNIKLFIGLNKNDFNDLFLKIKERSHSKITRKDDQQRKKSSAIYNDYYGDSCLVTSVVDGSEQRVVVPMNSDLKICYYSGKKGFSSFNKQVFCSPNGKIKYMSHTRPGSRNDQGMKYEVGPFLNKFDDSFEYIMGNKGFQGSHILYKRFIVIDREDRKDGEDDERKEADNRFKSVRIIIENVFYYYFF
ncbi:hypothetical protein PPL_01906 [Heterostelium album PN500]|uniref:DDE Tnp4 domain-containing protein n=1 Tax=Heterostelium pallidum (strain ATCC 26659 / Pp 5 / PN500) TaxID=670386 RepID=D3B0T9_HETP5|nr:hypothetical protein PPL_01906 [Heterostelium album PN500]EFA84913.1 hypothetical protein PPL_01906 [Heterostelium album PN500]|eukprot:XP_020437023.1 hypothetical protein PPL_01906 [Heterostelium album PN500]